DPVARDQFNDCLKRIAPQQYTQAAAQGDRYFFIPALDRHRGISHFYLENYNSEDEQADSQLAQNVGETVIDTYSNLLLQAIENHPLSSAEDYAQQRAYHTLYFLQVLTLDRGTTSGLLVHNENDVGILGSLPAIIDRSLLATWRDNLKPPQAELLDGLLTVLSSGICVDDQCLIDNNIKQALANEVRRFYQANPEALKLQASAEVIPLTVENHR
ncbi:MAG: coproporphyrinogen III oxidase, partial [Gammaproteobacteria bacterium]|nr:coproporphyrinogen III oxidase [Gammaproteobacteria bacterium]